MPVGFVLERFTAAFAQVGGGDLAGALVEDPAAVVAAFHGALFTDVFAAVLPEWDGQEPPRAVVEDVTGVVVVDGVVRVSGRAYLLG